MVGDVRRARKAKGTKPRRGADWGVAPIVRHKLHKVHCSQHECEMISIILLLNVRVRLSKVGTDR